MPLMIQDLLEATLQTISAQVTVEWPPGFKKQYASRRSAIEDFLFQCLRLLLSKRRIGLHRVKMMVVTA